MVFKLKSSRSKSTKLLTYGLTNFDTIKIAKDEPLSELDVGLQVIRDKVKVKLNENV